MKDSALRLEQAQRVFALYKWEVDRFASLPVRFENAADHFDGDSTGMGVAKWCAVVVAGIDEVSHGEGMVVHAGNDVFLILWQSNAGR